MGKIASYGLLCVIGCVLTNVANATSLQECHTKEKNNAPIEDQLACYKSLAELQAPTSQLESGTQLPPKSQHDEEPNTEKNTAASREYGLIAEWNPNQENALTTYKQNYLLPLDNSSNPNNAPTSPNPNNQVPFSYPLSNKEVKFQFSVKTKLGSWGSDHTNTLWMAYTQQSFWQIFDTSHSRPFRESNYEPEVIYSKRFLSGNQDNQFQLRILNAGIVHQSNGQSDPRSRSWNRLYVQPGFEKDFPEGGKFIVLPRLWLRIFQEKNPLENDNPDITHYLGYGDIEVRYLGDVKQQYSILARIRSLQVDLAYPINKVLPVIRRSDLNAHFQYFTGYGESLIDYNQRHNSWGIGISLPY